jgi:hypothetical protein
MRRATATALVWLALALPALAQDGVPAAAMPTPASPAARVALQQQPQSPPRQHAAAVGETDGLTPTERVRLDVPMDVALAAAFIRLRARPF